VSELKQQFTLANTRGLHAALASEIVRLTSKYDAEVHIEYEDKIIDAKSILGLLSLAIPYGENLQVIATGNQAEAAISDLQKLLSKEGQQ
jgi:phosphocarrier protein